MNPIFDHILAMVVVSAIFISTVVIMPQINMGNIAAVEQQQLRNMALNLFNAILLDTGNPVDWGSIVNGTCYFHPSVVKRFGLASNYPTTFYVLDPDKVQRLNIYNPLGYIPYDYLKSILNLQGHGFSFRLIPPFNVTNVDGARIDENHPPLRFVGSTLMCAVKITHLDGTPIPNATAKGFVFYTKGGNFYQTLTGTTVSNASGICICPLVNESPDRVAVILRICVADVATILVVEKKDASVCVADVNIVYNKNKIVLRVKNSSNKDVNITINRIYVYTTNGEMISLYNGTNKDQFIIGPWEHVLWIKSFTGLSELNPAVLIFALSVDGEKIVVVGPFRNLLNYNVFEYGGKVPVNSGAVKLQRTVIIGGVIYTAELWLWRE